MTTITSKAAKAAKPVMPHKLVDENMGQYTKAEYRRLADMIREATGKQRATVNSDNIKKVDAWKLEAWLKEIGKWPTKEDGGSSK